MRLPANAAARASAFDTLGAKGAHDALIARAGALSPEEQLRQETVLALKTLKRRPDVASAELNTIARPALVPADPLYTLQWHYPMIRLPQAWDATTGDPNVIVAVVDTGVVLSHPDLQGQLIDGYDFISSASRARDGNGIDPNPDDPGDLAFGPGASSFHGTHVAGTVGAASDNALGVAGVAWGARVMPVRVLGVQGGTIYDILQGVRFAAGLPNDSGTVPTQPADVINLSLTGGGFSQLAQDVFSEARAAGAVVVAAAGNEATNAPAFPASYDGVISVSAVDLNQRRALYSNYGATVDLAAPGGDTSVDRNGDSWADGVLSTIASDASGTLTYAYGFSQGTSMAAPHVAGVVALMRSVEPALSPAQVDGLLEAGLLTDDLGAPGRDDFFGHGLVDAHAAVLAAGAAPPDPSAALTVTPSGLNFGVALLEAELDLANASSDPLTITQITNDSGGWLGVEALEIDAEGLGRYRVTVARGGLAAGTYAAGIDIVSSAGTTRVPVVMRVGGPMTSDAGFHFVALVDAETLVPLDEIGISAVDGAYAFRFENVPEGDYLLIAGTDLDNDGFICDGGEACGSYPTLDVATPIHVDQDLENADFGTGFRQSIGAGVAETVALPAVRY
jgi:serine protease